jgi:hypothetical protein
MVDVVIEIIGSFIWINGNTKPYKEELKKLKFKWSNNKSAWYMSPENYRKHGKKNYDMNTIRDMYGSSTIKKDEETQNKKEYISA